MTRGQSVRAEKPRATFSFRSARLGGEGKHAGASGLLTRRADWPGCDARFAWPFTAGGTREKVAA